MSLESEEVVASPDNPLQNSYHPPKPHFLIVEDRPTAAQNLQLDPINPTITRPHAV